MPYNQIPPERLMHFYLNIQTPYVAIGNEGPIIRNFKTFCLRSFKRITKTRKHDYVLNNMRELIQKRTSILFVGRTPITSYINPKDIVHLLETMNWGGVL